MQLRRNSLFYTILFATLEIVFHFSYKFAVLYSYIKPDTIYFLNVRFFELIFIFFFGFFTMRFLCGKRIVRPVIFYGMRTVAAVIFVVFLFEIMFFEVISANLNQVVSPILPKILMYSAWLPFTLVLGCACGYFFKPRLRLIQ